MAEKTDKKGIIKALVFALFLAFLGIGILGWQYRRIESEEVPALEEKLEQKSVEVVLEKFMHSRIQQSEKAVMNYLTERAVEGAATGEFSLLNNMERYEILNSEKLADGRYRYAIKIYEEGEMNDFVEVVIFSKILGQYYIDSVEMGG
ncbi:MAG: hypothetical protein ABIB55_02760 [Candidatus Nealsonbacteria bacterium]